MKFELRGRAGASNLVLFFSGFGSHPAHFECCAKPENSAFCMVYDYSSCDEAEILVRDEEKLSEIIAQFKSVQICAWSLGVAVCARLKIFAKFASKNPSLSQNLDKIQSENFKFQTPQTSQICEFSLAINGTNAGIHRTQGIHPAVFARTVRAFDAERFAAALTQNAHFRPNLALRENLENELKSLEIFCQKTAPQDIKWQRGIVSLKDAIFPPKAVQNAPEFAQILALPNAEHFIFYEFKNIFDLK